VDSTFLDTDPPSVIGLWVISRHFPPSLCLPT
jgi:hypothetical protein